MAKRCVVRRLEPHVFEHRPPGCGEFVSTPDDRQVSENRYSRATQYIPIQRTWRYGPHCATLCGRTGIPDQPVRTHTNHPDKVGCTLKVKTRIRIPLGLPCEVPVQGRSSDRLSPFPNFDTASIQRTVSRRSSRLPSRSARSALREAQRRVWAGSRWRAFREDRLGRFDARVERDERELPSNRRVDEGDGAVGGVIVPIRYRFFGRVKLSSSGE